MGQSKRMAEFDILKGVAIYLVVMGHILTMCIRQIDSAVAFKIIGEVHMPIFFFISGYFTYKAKDGVEHCVPGLKKRFYQLIVPFLAVSALWMWYFPHSHLLSPLSQSWSQLLTTAWKDGYWFTLTLFEAVALYAVFAVLLRRLKSGWHQGLLLAGVYVLLIVVSRLLLNFDGSEVADNYDPAGLWLLTRFFPVFVMGVFARKYADGFRRLYNNHYVVFASAIVFFCMWYYAAYEWEFEQLPNWLVYVSQPLLHASLVVMAFFLVFKARIDSEHLSGVQKVFVKLGNNSLGIYLLHYFFLFPLTSLQDAMRAVDLAFLPTVVTAAFFAVFVVAAAYAATWAVGKNRILAFLLIGKTVK